MFFDALRVKIRDEGAVRNKAVYLAIGVRCSGQKEILGLWIEQSEGAKFWLRVMTELKNRGVRKTIAKALRAIYQAETAELAADRLEVFDERHDIGTQVRRQRTG